MSDLQRLSFSIEKPLYDKLEKLVRESGYENRSEFVRDMIRQQLVRESWEKNEEAVGTVTLVYDHHASRLTEKLTDMQHDHHHSILFTTHVHLTHELCVEVILVRGRGEEIRTLADKLRKLKGVLHANLAISSTGKELV